MQFAAQCSMSGSVSFTGSWGTGLALGQRPGSEGVSSFQVTSQGGLRLQQLASPSIAVSDSRTKRQNVSVIAARGTEGATEEDMQAVQSSPLQTPSRGVPVRPLPSPSLAPGSATPEEVSSSIDRIELQAKSSIDRLKHILYKLKSRPTVAETTILASGSDLQDMNDSLSSTTVVREEEREIYISQKIEVDMSPSDQLEGAETMEPAVDAELVGEPMSAAKLAESVPKANDSAEEIAMPDTLVHIDSLTCTSTTVQFDEENQTAIVTVTATVRGADFKSQTAYTERTVAMAARALTRTCLALDEKAQLALVGTGPLAEILPSSRQKQHDDLLRQLALGKIVSFQPVAEGQGSTPFRQVYDVLLATEEGWKVEAVFKPMAPGDVHGRWKRAPADWVAYQMAAILGIDMVAPAVIRRDVSFGGQNFSTGVISYKVAGLQPLADVLPKEWGEESAETAISNAHILDALLGSAPRRKEAFKAGRHWTGLGDFSPVLVEHPMGPALGDLHSMWSQRGEIKGVKNVSPVILSRLRGLNRGVLLEALSGALTAQEMELILEKRDQVVAYFDAMASRHGRHLVIR